MGFSLLFVVVVQVAVEDISGERGEKRRNIFAAPLPSLLTDGAWFNVRIIM